MRVLLLTETLLPGGAEAFVVRLANALASDHEVTLAVMHGEQVHPCLAARVDERIRLERLRLPGKRILSKLDSALRRAGVELSVLHLLHKNWLRRLVARDRPTILHSHLLKADRAASELCTADPDLRHVITIHGDYAPSLSGEFDPHMLRPRTVVARIVTGADAIVAVSKDQMAFFTSRYAAAARKLHLIYNGYAAPPDKPGKSRSALELPESRFLFGMVSRGVEQKGWARAIAAFEALGRSDVALVLVGDGPYIEQLRGQAVPSGVILAGFRADPLELVRHFDAGLLPTLFPHESLPTVIVEYLACEVPVVATDVGEIAEMLRAPSGEMAGTLLSFAGQDVSVPELAAAMQRLIDDPGLRSRQAALAREAFAKFDMDECAARYVALYGQVLG